VLAVTKLILLTLLTSTFLSAEPKVDLRSNYERIMVVVPMTGTGSWTDPKRPLFAPATLPPPGTRTGILAYSFQSSDDGQLALVEFVARDKSAFRTLLADPRIVKSFQKGKHTRNEIEKEFKKHKKDFDFDRFGTRVN
jgi:hypothetical protein